MALHEVAPRSEPPKTLASLPPGCPDEPYAATTPRGWWPGSIRVGCAEFVDNRMYMRRGNEPSALSVSIWPTTRRRSLAGCDSKLPQHCQVVPHHPMFGQSAAR